ncbi:FG-GAP-like repeat-containing protein [Streptomyces violascens]|uniref:FG-GAP-like repeat-containing protein n=1 Tax=Streptomyces violascens TaxID=67381 RepID=UPI001676BC38|nr:FG-GAP-like repeat-containing protein [Streptomyces violascens]
MTVQQLRRIHIVMCLMLVSSLLFAGVSTATPKAQGAIAQVESHSLKPPAAAHNQEPMTLTQRRNQIREDETRGKLQDRLNPPHRATKEAKAGGTPAVPYMFDIDYAQLIGPDGSLVSQSTLDGSPSDFLGAIPHDGDKFTIQTELYYENMLTSYIDKSDVGQRNIQFKVTYDCMVGNQDFISRHSDIITASAISDIYAAWPRKHNAGPYPPFRHGVPFSYSFVFDSKVCLDAQKQWNSEHPGSRPTVPDKFHVSIYGQYENGSWPTSDEHSSTWDGTTTGGIALSSVPSNQTYGTSCGGNSASAAQCQVTAANGVNTATGAFGQNSTDASSGGDDPILLERSYSSNNLKEGSFGLGWSTPWDASLSFSGNGDALFHAEDGSEYPFDKQPDGSFSPPPAVGSSLSAMSGGGYSLVSRTGDSLEFDTTGRLAKKKSQQNKATIFSYGADGKLAKIANPSGRTAAFQYDSGRISKAVFSDSRTVSYSYSGAWLSSVTGPGGNSIHYLTDASGRISSIVDARGNSVAQNTFDESGRITEQKTAGGGKYSFAYKGGETDITAPDGGVWSDVYSANVLLSRYDPLGNRASYEYDYQLDPISVTDSLGRKRTSEFDAAGRVVTISSPLTKQSWSYYKGNLYSHYDENGHRVSYGYDSNNRLINANDAAGGTTVYAYTPSGQNSSVASPGGRVTTYAYDSDGNQTSIAYPSGDRLTKSFDSAGRVTSSIDPRGNTSGANPGDYATSYSYDGAGRIISLTDPKGGKTLYTYDGVGNLLSETDSASRATSFIYDAANRLTETKDPAGNVSTTTYDVMGRVTARTDAAGGKTSYTYDKAGRVLTMTTPRGNTAGAKAADFTWSYGYDKVGNRITVTDPAGQTTATAYDAENRPVSVTDPLGQVTSTKYDGVGNVLETTDAMGKVTTNTYDADNRLTTVKDPNGNTVTYGYDADSNRTSETTPLGFKTTYGYDANGRLTTRVDPRGNVAGADPAQFTWKTAYDAAGNRTSETDPLGNKTTYSSDALNNPVERTDPLGRKTTYEYDAVGNLSKVTAPDGGVTSYAYDALGNQTSRTDANQHTTAFSYDPVGRLVKATDPLTRVRSYSYDAEGNPGTVVNARGQTVTNSFDFRGQVTKSTASDGTPTVSLNYDALGRPAQISDGAGSRSFTYDPAGRLTAVTPGAGGGAFAYSYDAAGRMTERSAPAQRQALDWSAAARTVAGDLNGDGITDVVRIDSKNGIQSFLGSKAAVFTPAAQQSGSGSGFSQVFTGDYTGDGQLDLVAVDKSNGHLLRYTGDGNGGFAAPADLGGGWGALSLTAGDFNGDGKPDFLVLDSSANAMYFYPGKGDGTFGDRINLGGGWNTYRLTALDFNKDGKTDLLTVNSADGHLYFYPGKGNGAFGDRLDLGGGWGSMYFTPGDFNGDGKADLLANDTASHKLRFYPGTGTGAFGDYIAQDDDWTPYGQPIAGQFDSDSALDAIATDSAGHLQTWHGNGAGKLTNRTPAATLTSTKTTYTYDNDGRPSSQTTNGATLTYAYDPAGNLTGTTLPAGNGNIESRSYDQAGRLTQIGSARTTSPLAGRPLKGTALSGTVLNNWQATLNPVGQPTRIDASRAGQSDISRYYSYDSTGRLQTECTAAAKADTCPKTDPDTAYAYDKVGNRLTKTAGGTSTTYAYDAADQLTGTTTPGNASQSFSYDADGNQTSNGTDTLTYDAANRVARVKTGTDTLDFTYDADGNRTAAAVNGIQRRATYWDINNPLPQVSAETDGSQVASYTYNPLGQIQTSQQGPSAFYYHHDGLGSVTDLTDAAGTNQYRYAYDAFGGLTTDKLTASPPANPFTYTGQYKEPTTETLGYNLRARNYAPDQGRFTSRDPETQSPLDPYAADYGYADNQPTSLTDPSGRCPLCVSIGVGAVLGAVIDGGVYSWQHRNGDFSWNGLGHAAAKGAIIGGISGAFLPGTGNAVARGFELAGARAIATSAAVNGAVGAGITWGINQATCQPTTPLDLLFGAAGGSGSSLVGPAFSWLRGLVSPRAVVSAQTQLQGLAFRGLRPHEDPPSGLSAPGTNEDLPAFQHVVQDNDSPWISLTRDPKIAYGKYGGKDNGMVSIDLGQVDSHMLDAAAHLPIPHEFYQFAQDSSFRDKEILVKLRIDARAIVHHWPAGTPFDQILEDIANWRSLNG